VQTECLLPSYVNQDEKDEVGRVGFGFGVNIVSQIIVYPKRALVPSGLPNVG
jgi:hypothetical protein